LKGLPRNIAIRTHPSFLLATIPFTTLPGMDRELVEQALELGIPIESLDPPADIIRVNLSFEAQEGIENIAEALAWAVHNPQQLGQKMLGDTVEFRALYLAGNTEALLGNFHDHLRLVEGPEAFRDYLQKPRHLHWYARINAFRKKVGSPITVAAGLSHILLKDWYPLTEHYESQGYKIIQAR